MSPVAVAKISYNEGAWKVPAHLGSALPCFRVTDRQRAGNMVYRRAEPRFLEPALVSLPEVAAMNIAKEDLATWVKLGMKRRVGEGFVATGTQVRAGAKCGHDSRCRGRGLSATYRGGSAECPHQTPGRVES